MSLCLSEKSFLKPLAKKEWLPLLELLKAFQEESESSTPSKDELQSLHDQIVSQSESLLEEDALKGVPAGFFILSEVIPRQSLEPLSF